MGHHLLKYWVFTWPTLIPALYLLRVVIQRFNHKLARQPVPVEIRNKD